MKYIRRFYLYSICMLCLASSAVSQDLIFSNDTAILISCEKTPPKIDSHWIYNTSDHDITLRWLRVQNQIPDESFYLMIFNGTQYPPFTNQGIQHLDAHDSTNIIFEFWHTDIVPGDSAILRIKVYDESDSIHTTHYQTVIQHCPLQTSHKDPISEPGLLVFPNPIHDVATILLDEFLPNARLLLTSTTGKIVSKIPVTNNEILFSSNGIPAGMYFLSVVQNGYVIHMTRVVIAE